MGPRVSSGGIGWGRGGAGGGGVATWPWLSKRDGFGGVGGEGGGGGVALGVESFSFFSAIVLFENRPFPWVFGGFLERNIPGKNVAMGQNPNRTPSEHPNPTTKIRSKMGGAATPKWYHWFWPTAMSVFAELRSVAPASC